MVPACWWLQSTASPCTRSTDPMGSGRSRGFHPAGECASAQSEPDQWADGCLCCHQYRCRQCILEQAVAVPPARTRSPSEWRDLRMTPVSEPPSPARSGRNANPARALPRTLGESACQQRGRVAVANGQMRRGYTPARWIGLEVVPRGHQRRAGPWALRASVCAASHPVVRGRRMHSRRFSNGHHPRGRTRASALRPVRACACVREGRRSRSARALPAARIRHLIRMLRMPVQ